MLPAGMALELASGLSPQVLTVLSGNVTIDGGETSGSLAAGRSAVIWPSDSGLVRIAADGEIVVLRSWVPDLQTEIVEPARLAGSSDRAIARLGAPLLDLQHLMHRSSSAG